MLSEYLIETLEPGETLRDTKVTGLHVIAHKDCKSYMLQYRDKNGISRRPKLGNVSELSIVEARKRALEKLAGERECAGQPLTLEELYDEWSSTDARKLKQATRRWYASLWQKHLQPSFGRQKLGDIQPKKVAALHARIGGVAANRAVAFLKTLYKFAIVMGHTRDNPAMHIRHHKETPRKRYITEAEYDKLKRALRALKKKDWVIFAHYVRLLILTGMRKNELAQMKWADIKDGKFIIADSKTGYKELPVSEQALAQLDSLAELTGKNQHLFPNTNDTKGARYDYRWKEFRKRAGLHDVSLHDIRRSFGVHALNGAAMPLELVSALLGHASIRTTERSYSWLLQDKKREASAKAASYLNEFI